LPCRHVSWDGTPPWKTAACSTDAKIRNDMLGGTAARLLKLGV
jgi:hypothetical protein